MVNIPLSCFINENFNVELAPQYTSSWVSVLYYDYFFAYGKPGILDYSILLANEQVADDRETYVLNPYVSLFNFMP